MGRGCAKTQAFIVRVESPSRFRQSVSQKFWWRNREKAIKKNHSPHTWLAHVFTKAGSRAGLPFHPSRNSFPRSPSRAAALQRRSVRKSNFLILRPARARTRSTRLLRRFCANVQLPSQKLVAGACSGAQMRISESGGETQLARLRAVVAPLCASNKKLPNFLWEFFCCWATSPEGGLCA